MMARKQVKNLEDLPAAIDVFEKDMKLYEATTAVEFPKEMRLPMLLKLMPDAYREDFQRKFTVGQRDFAKICEDILRHATEHRVSITRGPRDMEVDALSAPNNAKENTTDEWIA